MRRVFLLWWCLALAAEVNAPASDSEPLPRLPPGWGKYQVLRRSVAPNARYAFIYPRRPLLNYGYYLPRLFLVQLKPFKVISELPIEGARFMSRGSYTAKWAEDSSAAMFFVGMRWGPDVVWAIQVQGGRVINRTELASLVLKSARSDFWASGASRYNDNFEFVLNSSDEPQADLDDYHVGTESGWRFDGKGHILVDCLCDSDPKGMDSDRWAARFQGTWDLAKDRFIKKAVGRVYSPR